MIFVSMILAVFAAVCLILGNRADTNNSDRLKPNGWDCTAVALTLTCAAAYTAGVLTT